MKKKIASVLLATMALAYSVPAQTSTTVKQIPCVEIAVKNGDPDNGYLVQSSTNMVDWVPLAELPANGSGNYAYTNIPWTSPLFYRTPQAPSLWTMTLDAASPMTRFEQVSPTSQTEVVLSVYDLKSSVNNTRHRLVFKVNTEGTEPVQLYNNLKLVIGSTTYSASSIVSNTPGVATVTFDNLSLAFLSQIPKAMILKGIVRPGNEFMQGTKTWAVADPFGDSLKGGVVTLYSQGPIVPSGGFVEYSTIFIDNPPTTYVQFATYWFSIVASDLPVWVSKDPRVSLLISTNTVGLTVAPVDLQLILGDNAGSTATEYYMAPGAVKTFALTVRVAGAINASYGTVALTGIRYGLSSATATNYTITAGLEDLQAMFPH